MGILLSVFSAFAAGLLSIPLFRGSPRAVGWVLSLVPASVFAYLAGHVGGDPILVEIEWVPAADAALAFRLDGLALFFALVVSGVAAVVLVYSAAYVREKTYGGRFYSYMLVFVGAMLGLVLADNLITLYVFFEITGITSFLLIGLESHRQESHRAARQALLVTGAGGFALLAGILLLGEAGGSFVISELVERGDAVRSSPVYTTIVVLIAAGAFAKSAQMPLHFWLPNAMVAPTPVSAFLHAAAMVKAGIYVLARFSPVLGGTTLWTLLLATVGGFTMVAAAWLALRETDLKRVLAYATVMALGLMTMLLGVGSREAVAACLVYVAVHACYKAALFMTAGTLQHATGSLDLRELGGLARDLAPTFGVAVLAGLSMAGVVPFIGALGKEMTYKALLSHEVLIGAAIVANVALVAAAGMSALTPYVGTARLDSTGPASDREAGETEERPRVSFRPEASWWIAPGVLSAAGIGLGIAAGRIDGALVEPAVADVLGEAAVVEMHVWAGVTTEVALSLATLVLGAATFLAVPALRSGRTLGWLGRAIDRAPDQLFEAGRRVTLSAASALTNRLQNGLLRHYLYVVFGTAVCLLVAALAAEGVAFPDFAPMDVRLHEWMLAGIIVAAALSAIFVHSRLGVILLLSTVGYGNALIYLIFGAPDLALTQILVETLLAVLIVLAFVDLPGLEMISTRRSKSLDAALSAACGAVVTVLMLTVTSKPFDHSVADYYAAASYAEAHGRNIVNVILTDFRALDTMVEIMVLAVAGASVFALVRRLSTRGEASADAGEEHRAAGRGHAPGKRTDVAGNRTDAPGGRTAAGGETIPDAPKAGGSA